LCGFEFGAPMLAEFLCVGVSVTLGLVGPVGFDGRLDCGSKRMEMVNWW